MHAPQLAETLGKVAHVEQSFSGDGRRRRLFEGYHRRIFRSRTEPGPPPGEHDRAISAGVIEDAKVVRVPDDDCIGAGFRYNGATPDAGQAPGVRQTQESLLEGGLQPP